MRPEIRAGLKAAALLLGAVTLKIAVLPAIAVFIPAAPDPLLVLVALWGALRGPRTGEIVGLASGAAIDLLSTMPVGVHAGAYMLAGFVAGSAARYLRPDLLSSKILVVPFASMAATGLLAALAWLAGTTAGISARVAVAEAGSSALLAALVAWPLAPILDPASRWRRAES